MQVVKQAAGVVFKVVNAANDIIGTPPTSVNGFISGSTTSDAGILIAKIFNYIIAVLIVVAVGALIYAGYLYISSATDSNKIKAANQAVIYTLVGLALVIAASAVVNFVMALLV